MRYLRTTVALLALLLGLAACSGAGDSGEAGTDADGGAEIAQADMAASEDDDGEAAREVVVTGSLTLVAEDARYAMDEIVRVVGELGGRVQERSEHASGAGDDVEGWLTVRVPAAEVTTALDRFEGLGETTDVSITSEDVTRQGRDLDARIAALQTSTERLLGLMEEAGSSEQLLAAEEALSQRQSELEALQAERAYLSEQVAMSTLHISVSSEETVQLEAGGFLGGLEDGWSALVTFAGGLLVALGAALPWLLVVGAPLAVVVGLLRRRRRRSAPTEPAAA